MEFIPQSFIFRGIAVEELKRRGAVLRHEATPFTQKDAKQIPKCLQIRDEYHHHGGTVWEQVETEVVDLDP
jgi:hypothetical protein